MAVFFTEKKNFIWALSKFFPVEVNCRDPAHAVGRHSDMVPKNHALAHNDSLSCPVIIRNY